MKGIKECKVLHLIFLFLFCKICAYEKHIVVVVPSRNNSQWYKKNLDSVLNQKYSNYQVIYIDDQSTDNNGILVENYLKKGFDDD